jgi:hypothetical protein
VIALDPGTITMIQGIGFLDSGIRFISWMDSWNRGGARRTSFVDSASIFEDAEEKSDAAFTR